MKVNKKVVIIGLVVVFVVVFGLVLLLSGDKLDSDKKVQGLVISHSNVTFDESLSVSFLSANVKNSSKEMKEDIKLKIVFLDKSNKEITSVTGFLGDVESNETRELNAAVSMKLDNVHNIKYEVVE
ncbi:hypothetical protein D3C80_1372230 [compost metagenome]